MTSIAATLHLMSGPAVGWYAAMSPGFLAPPLAVLYLWPGACVGPLVAFALRPSLVRLLVAVSSWYFVTYLFAIAIWI